MGSAILLALIKNGYQTKEFEGEVTDSSCVNRNFRTFRADVVIHTAAFTDVNKCEKNKKRCYEVNYVGTHHLLASAKKIKARFIYISTASVFSGQEGNYNERDKPDPKNYYSLTKLLGEAPVIDYKKGTVTRINIIGIHKDGSRGKNFFEWLVDSVEKNEDIKLFKDVIINPLSNHTLAELIILLIRNKSNPKIINLASRGPLSKAAIGEIVIGGAGHYAGKMLKTSLDSVSMSAARPKNMTLSFQKAEAFFSKKMPSLKSEIKKILKMRQHEQH